MIDPNEPPVEIGFFGPPAERMAQIEKRKKPISLGMEVGMISRLRRIAHRCSIGYRTLIRMWIAERLE